MEPFSEIKVAFLVLTLWTGVLILIYYTVVRDSAPDTEDLHRDIGWSEQKRRWLHQRLIARDKYPYVQNRKIYGPDFDNVIIVQSYHSPRNLRFLIKSLVNVRGINRTLVIFSHMNYDETIEVALYGVYFCQWMEIFYPYSYQTLNYPKEIPHVSLVKSHWVWTLNYVFDYLEEMRNYTNDILILDDSSYVLPDVFHWQSVEVTKSLPGPIDTWYSTAMVVLGLKTDDTQNYDFNRVRVSNFLSVYDNGLMFDRSTWWKLRFCIPLLCRYNDSSWSKSLAGVVDRCFSFMFIDVLDAPKVLSPNTCILGVERREDARCAPLMDMFRRAAKRDFSMPAIISGKRSIDPTEEVLVPRNDWSQYHATVCIMF